MEPDGRDGPAAEAESLARYRAASRRRRSAAGSPDRGRAIRGRTPATPSGPRPDGRDPQLLGDVWRALADGRGWTNEVALWSLTNRWEALVGPQVAQHVAVVAFDPLDTAAPGNEKPEPSAPDPSHRQAALLPAPEPSGPVQQRPSAPEPSGGKLTVRADSAAWQQQMIWNLAHLQRRLDVELGTGVVGRIVVLGPNMRTQSYGPRRVRG
jgi:predicted nucleic acid-binding Zn ribbon protein